MPIELTVEQQALQSLARAVKAEADGKQLRRDLTRNMRAALEPAKEQARSNLMGIASAGLNRGTPLRTTVAQQMKAEARLSGRTIGARLRVRRKGMPRGFNNAPKALSNPKGWRHQVFGGGVWVQQVAVPPEWFDRATREHRDSSRDAVLEAMDDMAGRIISRVK